MDKKTFSNETLNAAVDAMNELKDEIINLREQVKDEPVNEVSQRYLMDKLCMTQSEAEEICNNIQNGISEFRTQFKANSEKGSVNLRKKLKEAMSDMKEEKKADFLSAILTAFNVSQCLTMDAEQIAELQATNAKRPTDELITEIESLFGDKFPMDGLSDFADANIDTDAIIKLSHQIDMSKDEYQFISAIILYTGQYEGKIKLSDSEEPIPANLIGSLTCAGIETISITGELKEGKIDLKRWQTILKWILGTLLACSLGYLALLALACVSLSVIGLMLSVFGTSTIALIVTSIVSLFVCWDISKYSTLGLTSILEILSSIYDQYIEPITQKINNLATTFQDFFKSLLKRAEAKIHGSGKTEETNNEESIVQSTVITV